MNARDLDPRAAELPFLLCLIAQGITWLFVLAFPTFTILTVWGVGAIVYGFVLSTLLSSLTTEEWTEILLLPLMGSLLLGVVGEILWAILKAIVFVIRLV